MTTKSHAYPTGVVVDFAGEKCWVVLDQIGTIDKVRVVKRLGMIKAKEIREIKGVISAMQVE